MVSLNMNDEVEVTLTDKGLATLALDVGETNRFLPPSCRLPTSISSAWTGPLHELFRIFGPSICFGHPSPFEGNQIRVIRSRGVV